MKVNPILAILAFLLAGLVFYGFYVAADGIVYPIVAGVVALFSLMPAMALSFKNSGRMSVMFKCVGWSFFFIFLILDICMVWLLANIHVTLIVNGVLLVVELLSLYGVGKAAQND